MPEKVYRRFERNLIIFTLLIALVPFTLFSAIIFVEYSLVYRGRIEEQISYRARAESNKVDFFLEERAAVLSSIADLHSMDELVEGNNLARVFEIMGKRTGGFVDLGVIDDKGRHLAYVGPYNLQGLDYYQQPWFAEVMAKGIFISDVYMGFRRIPHFIIAVRRQENHRSWILRATIDSDIFNVLVREAKIGRTGDAFIINSEGIYQTQPRFGSGILTASGLDPSEFGQGAVVEKATAKGEKTLYVGNWLKKKDWLLIIQQDPTEGMSRFLATRNYQIPYLVIACIAIVLITFFTTRLSVGRLRTFFRRTGEINAQILQDDKLTALGRMAAGIAHEINNPLAVINENAGWMKDLLEEEEFKGSANYAEYCAAMEKISTHVERARTIILNMLNYARKMEPHVESVDVNDVIRQTVSFVGTVARMNNIRFQMDLSADLPSIASERSKLQQVFLNIINNAIEACGEEGLICITSGVADSRLQVNIRDNGPGIPPELRKMIFDPFFSSKPGEKGTGLGLWICRNIVEHMGGTIELESQEGQGAKFIVTLPIT